MLYAIAMGQIKIAANVFKKLCTKVHQNRPSFIEDTTRKHFCLFFGHSVYVKHKDVEVEKQVSCINVYAYMFSGRIVSHKSHCKLGAHNSHKQSIILR